MIDFFIRLKRIFGFSYSLSWGHVWINDKYLGGYQSYFEISTLIKTLYKEIQHPIFGIMSKYWDKDRKIIVAPAGYKGVEYNKYIKGKKLSKEQQLIWKELNERYKQK
jgi:hypothetical protein